MTVFANANSRDTYFSVHNVKTAHKISTGKGVKVGIMDWSFGCGSNKNLYVGAENFAGYKTAPDEEGHGFWMANTLKEIAPDCEMYALCTTDKNEDVLTDNMVTAIRWAVQNFLNMTYCCHIKYTILVASIISYICPGRTHAL